MAENETGGTQQGSATREGGVRPKVINQATSGGKSKADATKVRASESAVQTTHATKPTINDQPTQPMISTVIANAKGGVAKNQITGAQTVLTSNAPKIISTNHWAVAFINKSSAKGFTVKFGVQRSNAQGTHFDSHLALDDNFKVTKLKTNETTRWDNIIFNSQLVMATFHLKDKCPEVGQFWRPEFAIKATAKKTWNEHPDELQDAGDLCDMADVLGATDQHSNELLKNIDGCQKTPWTAENMSGATMLRELSLPFVEQESLTSLIAQALAKSTQQEHRRMLVTLSALSTHLHHLPLPVAIATHLHDLSQAKFWAPTTLFKYMCTAQGALRLLPVYRKGGKSISLNTDPQWLLAMRGARQKAVEHIPNQPKAASSADVAKALHAAKGDTKENVRAVLMLGWLTAGRLGCIRQLKSEDLVFDKQQKTLHITFRRGKGVRCRRTAYTVTTLILSGAWWYELTNYVSKRPTFLFPRTLPDKAITTALSAAGIEQRSIRRGALQTMAAQNVPPEILMNFSGHSSINTLNRYLDFGKKRFDLASKCAKAATALWKTELLEDEWWDTEVPLSSSNFSG